MQSDAWLAWLQVARNFHTYSFRNQLLIAMQDPDATRVAGYRAWQAIGRQVRRGEKAITIMAPVTKPLTTPDGAPVLDAAGNTKREIVGVKPASVFDISQTDGPPLPQADHPTTHLSGHAPEGMWDNLHHYATRAGFTVQIGPCRPEGLTSFTQRAILVREGFEPAHAASVLAHEIGHVSMHDPGALGTRDGGYCRGMVEVEAESFAWLVNNEWGLDSSTDSFQYLAGWATRAAQQERKTPEEVLTASAERVRAAVSRYLDYRHPEPPEHPTTALADQVKHQVGINPTQATRTAPPAPETTRGRASRRAAAPTR
nr:ArdC-like ssDNA-binding domain-containing protein [Tessaracoccus sp. OS52]